MGSFEIWRPEDDAEECCETKGLVWASVLALALASAYWPIGSIVLEEAVAMVTVGVGGDGGLAAAAAAVRVLWLARFFVAIYPIDFGSFVRDLDRAIL
jgi:hypothetical protein